jgi:hypothetical protein
VNFTDLDVNKFVLNMNEGENHIDLQDKQAKHVEAATPNGWPRGFGLGLGLGLG